MESGGLYLSLIIYYIHVHNGGYNNIGGHNINNGGHYLLRMVDITLIPYMCRIDNKKLKKKSIASRKLEPLI